MFAITEKNVINTVKNWLFPSVLSVLAIILYDDIKEIKTDVKRLLAQSAADHVEINNLKQQVNYLNNKVFVNIPLNDIPSVPDSSYSRLVATIINNDETKKKKSI